MGDDWDDSMQSKEKIEANLLSKQMAAIRRERALAYAYSHQVTGFIFLFLFLCYYLMLLLQSHPLNSFFWEILLNFIKTLNLYEGKMFIK